MSSIETQRRHQIISAAFQQSGHAPLASTLLTKVSSLSESLHLTPKEIVDAWEAHSLTKNVDSLDEASFGGFRLALSKLAGGGGLNKNGIVMSGTGLDKRTNSSKAGVTPSPMAKRAATSTIPTGAATPAADNTTNRDGLSAIDNLTTPSGKGVAASPKSKSSASTASVITPIPHSNPTFKSSTTVKYTERTNSGEIVASFNPNNLSTCSEILSAKSEDEKKEFASRRVCSIAVHPTVAEASSRNNTSGYRHMFAPLEKRSAALEHRLLDMKDAICDMYKYMSEEDEMMELTMSEDGSRRLTPSDVEEKEGGSRNDVLLWTPVGLPKQNKVVCVGRICNEAHEGRLNRASIQLEGSRHHSLGSRIHLDLQTLNETNGEDNAKPQAYSLFPGQIVAVEGINSSGRTMQAARLIEGAAPPPPPSSPSCQLLEYDNSNEQQEGGQYPLSIMSVAGPFTTHDNLDYDPFIDVLMNVIKYAPDVVILCGPFVDERQPLVATNDGGGPTMSNDYGEEVTVSYEYLFSKNISELLEDLYMKEPELKTQFVLVPSLDDAFVDAVYPQPPFPDGVDDDEECGSGVVKVPKGSDAEGRFGDLGLYHVENAGREQPKSSRNSTAKEDRPKRRVHCVSNPCTLQIDDITIGVTSTDILFHISSEECNANLPPGTRLARIAQHLIQQRSYYPLFPPAKGASLDFSKSKEWEMTVKPDILIVPSKLNSFARQVLDTTIVVNPGELTKNVSGGTYAMIDVHPRKSKEELQALAKNYQGLQDRVRVDIRRI